MAVGYGKIEPAVEIGIEKNTSEPQTILGSQAHSGLRRNIFVGFAPELVQACHFIVEVRDGHAGTAGVCEIRNVHAHAGSRLALAAEGQSSLDSGISKSSVA